MAEMPRNKTISSAYEQVDQMREILPYEEYREHLYVYCLMQSVAGDMITCYLWGTKTSRVVT